MKKNVSTAGYSICIRCGSWTFHNGECSRCECCGEYAVLEHMEMVDLINELYSQQSFDGESFKHWIERMNNNEN